MTTPQGPHAEAGRNDVYLFFALACGITWVLDFPLAFAWATHAEPAAYAMPMTGLGAWGPTLAAFVLAARRGPLRGVFGRGRTAPIWFVAPPLVPPPGSLPAPLIAVLHLGDPEP